MASFWTNFNEAIIYLLNSRLGDAFVSALIFEWGLSIFANRPYSWRKVAGFFLMGIAIFCFLYNLTFKILFKANFIPH